MFFSFLIALSFTGIGYYLFGRDWPRLYLASIFACGFKEDCVINLTDLYGTNWDEMIWLPLYNRELKGVEGDEDEGFCERMFFLRSGRIEFSYHSACLDFPSKREKMVFFSSETALKIRKENPFLCVKKNSNGDNHDRISLPHYSIDRCNTDPATQ